MDRQDRIYDIVSRHFIGTITNDEREELEEWLAESPDNKDLMEQFMAREDMLQMSIMPRVHRDGGIVFDDDYATHTAVKPQQRHRLVSFRASWTRSIAVASVAVVLLAVGITLWNDYCKVVVPEVDEVTLAVMRTSMEVGRSDATVTIRSRKGKREDVTLASSVDVKDNQSLDKLCQSIQDERQSSVGNDFAESEELLADIVTHHDKEFWLTLSDGTRVHLNYNSSMTYPIQFVGDSREVYLEGEAYFFVAKDRRHPFIVHTRYGDIKQYGTEFYVNTRYNSQMSTGAYGIKGKGLAVVLVEGSIGVTPIGKTEHRLKPNELAVVSEGDKELKVTTIYTTPFTSWNTGSFAFEDCPLDKLMDVLGRWYGKEIRFADESLRSERFTGEIDCYEQLDHIMSSLSKSTSIDMSIEGNTIVIGK